MHPLGQGAVDGRVDQRAGGQGGSVGGEDAQCVAARREQEQVTQRAQDAHSGKREELIGRDLLELRLGVVGRGACLGSGTTAGHAPDAAQVTERGGDDVHPRIRIVHPVHRHFADAQAESLGRDQQLGVEEPLLVLDQREQLQRGVAIDGLEATLGVAHPRVQEDAEQQVVGARDEFSLRSAHDARAAGQSGADGNLSVARQEGSDQWQERRERSGEIDVHVGHHARGGAGPGSAQREAAALAGE